MGQIALGVVAGLALVSGAVHAAYSLGGQVNYSMPAPTWQVKIGDVTGDGRNDVVALTNADGVSKLHVFAQKADGTLTNPPRVYAVPTSSMALALGDLNRDGIMDAVVGSYGAITVLTSDVAAPVPLKARTWNTGVGAAGIQLARMDRDDFLDVVFVDGNYSAPLRYFRGDGTGALEPTPIRLSRTNNFMTSMKLEVADIDGDGGMDMATTDFNGMVRVIYSNRGHDFFRQETIDPGFAVDKVIARDFNGDGRVDLVVSGMSSYPTSRTLIYVYYQEPSGERFPQANASLTFADPQWSLSFDPLLAHDFDGDGDMDLLTSHPSGTSKLGLLSNSGQELGAEVLQNASSGDSLNMAAGDLNGDGCTDVVASGYYNWMGVYYGSGCAGSAPTPRPDLRLGLTASSTGATIKLSTIFSTTPVDQPLVEIAFSLTQGSLQLGTLPANCQLRSQSQGKASVDCLVASMGSAASTQLGIPVQVTTPPGVRARLGVAARALTDTLEQSKRNNAATATVGLAPAPLAPARAGATQTRKAAILRLQTTK